MTSQYCPFESTVEVEGGPGQQGRAPPRCRLPIAPDTHPWMQSASTMPSWPSSVFWHLYVVQVSHTCRGQGVSVYMSFMSVCVCVGSRNKAHVYGETLHPQACSRKHPTLMVLSEEPLKSRSPME